jgi:hypothetical protein
MLREKAHFLPPTLSRLWPWERERENVVGKEEMRSLEEGTSRVNSLKFDFDILGLLCEFVGWCSEERLLVYGYVVVVVLMVWWLEW